MKPPQAYYATTADGYNLAYTVCGSGRPMLLSPPLLSQVDLVWQWPARRALLEGLAQRFRLVHFDPRGQGMSTRGLPSDFSTDDYETDIETLAEHLDLRDFVLASTCLVGHAAIRYASKHPDRVSALVLISVAISNRAWPLEQLAGMARENWDLLLWSRLPPGLSEAPARLDDIRRAATPGDAERRWEGCAGSDVGDLLPRLQLPTLVLHQRNHIYLATEEVVKLASAIPNAQLALIDGDDPGALFGRPDDALAALDGFLVEAGLANAAAPPTRPGSSDTPLSRRQVEVLTLLIQGKTNREIAAELVLSLRTVERHIEELYAKLNVRNRARAIARALGPVGQK